MTFLERTRTRGFGIISSYVVSFSCPATLLAIFWVYTVNRLIPGRLTVRAAGVATGRTISSPCFALLLSLFLATGGDANLRTSCIRTRGFLCLACSFSTMVLLESFLPFMPSFAVLALKLTLAYNKTLS